MFTEFDNKVVPDKYIGKPIVIPSKLNGKILHSYVSSKFVISFIDKFKYCSNKLC